MLKPEAGLFERARNSPSAGVLPRPDAPLDKLKQLGRVLCKAVLDEHPIGAGPPHSDKVELTSTASHLAKSAKTTPTTWAPSEELPCDDGGFLAPFFVQIYCE